MVILHSETGVTLSTVDVMVVVTVVLAEDDADVVRVVDPEDDGVVLTAVDPVTLALVVPVVVRDVDPEVDAVDVAVELSLDVGDVEADGVVTIWVGAVVGE